ncbi:MAG: MBL fold metallo-hydrolase [Chloroflexi bacterium]|nr:MBL fold metallo-hydrolase [Chloroflexota bacterium]
MFLRYFYEQKLAHVSYLVGCQAIGEAIVIDPGRDIEPYLTTVESEGLRLVAATETHIHADFVSGARELAERTGATLYLSDEGDQNWKYQYLDRYQHRLLKDGDTFKIGNILFEVRHTPGHTPEHISLLVTDTAGANQPMGVFTGDFVFVGDVGRPDLLEKAAGIAGTAETGARQMFHSLQRFKQLPDFLQIWPAHGAGSACGRALGAVPSSTVGYEKLFNAALSFTDEATFARALLEGQPEPPRYFAQMKQINKAGPPVLRGLPVPEQLPFDRLAALLAQGATVVDTRRAAAFAAAHIPGTINIPHNNDFTTWAGWLLDYEQPFYLMAGSAAVRNIVRDLIYIGLDHVAGYCDISELEGWLATGHPQQSYEVITPAQIAPQVAAGEVTVIDVRHPHEWEAGHIPGACHMGLGYLAERVKEIPTGKLVLVQCQAGARSAIGASILQAKGIPNVINLRGGLNDWAAAGLPITR